MRSRGARADLVLVADYEQAFANAGQARHPFAVTSAELDTDAVSRAKPEPRTLADGALSANPAVRVWIRERDNRERCELLCQGDAAQRS
jgi:hypothetical protein